MKDLIEGLPEGLEITACDWPKDTWGLYGKPGDVAFQKRELLSEEALEDFQYFFPEYHSDGKPLSAEQYAMHPVLGAPPRNPSDGTVYFESCVPEDLSALLRVLDVDGSTKEYLAFAFRAANPYDERYLVQLKFVTFDILKSRYLNVLQPRDEVKALPMPPKQTLSLGEAALGFVESQTAYFEPGGYAGPNLRGVLVDRQDDECVEGLAFGLSVWRYDYRIWSRPWLVGK